MSNSTTTPNGQFTPTTSSTSTSSTFFASSPSTSSTSTTTTSPTSFSQTTTTTPGVNTPSSPATTLETTVTPTSNPANQPPTTVTLTSTSSTPTPTQNAPTLTSFSATSSSASSSASSTPLTNNGTAGGQKHGLSSAGTIAVGVVVPVVAVALIILALIWWWRKRKQRKDAEEMRRKEVEEYGFNPNKDPTLPAVGGASSNGGDDPYEVREDDTGGYRGWGNTSNPRKPSTTLSGGGPIGMAVSDPGSSTLGGPTAAGGSADSPPRHPDSAELPANNSHEIADGETVGALGGAPVAGANRQDIHRGPSNASSSYSAANRSDSSGEAGSYGAGANPANYYSNDQGPYFDDGTYPQGAGYGANSSYNSAGGGGGGGGQPVIRDVQARRNTRIENPSVVPQKGNTGISQNF